ncbi:DEAD/DEAH box helicase [Gordonia McavH-238-E]|uniref:DEAD/DEAH box helicase n=1 Tax=Gordonia sp. McavH-238-E TaxID=2917736 RepID=UPI001EF5C645|nr:DEAD/DEAH box helicase [Gordonia sp. McavH-238-E]MCG7630896.1 DEAD/DEAH box helicase [Gordonia sp. McavH-238-E]
MMGVNGNASVLETVEALTQLALRTYEVNPGLIEEHANGERRIHQGGYGDRQLFELVQNAADELRDLEFRGGRIEAVLTKSHLYCANEGSPITAAGTETILRMGVSRKRGGQIGRFGVGVKSVLSVTKTPQFFSSTGAFGFDADWSADEIRTAVNKSMVEQGRQEMDLADTPVLRLARPLNVRDERVADEVLDSLLAWATTVVRLPLLPGAAQELAKSMHKVKNGGVSPVEEFPTLFQLFSPHAGTVVLDDRHAKPPVRRELKVGHTGPVTIIHQTRTGSRPTDDGFRVFTMQHSVTDAVRSTSGELHDRALLDVSWAVPDYRVEKPADTRLWTVPAERGVFWSYFPTKYPMTLSGALNAAWKTNEDRQNLLDSAELNRELLNVAARLVIESLPDLVVDEDPAAFLALLPGRTRESPNWACKYLTGKVWELASKNPSLPDQDGKLREPQSLHIRPEKISHGTLSLWSEYEGGPSNWVHPSVDAMAIRRGKMAHILEATPGCQPESIDSWLEALVEDQTAEASKAALRVLYRLLTHDFSGDAELIESAKSARIVLTSRNEFVAPTSGQVYRKTSDDVLEDDLEYIADAIADDPSMGAILDLLGIREADTDGRFRSVLDQGFDGYTDAHWTRFWELVRVAGGAGQSRTILGKYPTARSVLRVKSLAGRFVRLCECLLPGPVVPDDGSRDADVTVDVGFHADDVSLLRALGMKDRPEIGNYDPTSEPWFSDYRQAQYERYCENLPGTSHRVQPQTLRIEGGAMAGPLQIFTRLSEEGKARFIAATPPDGLVTNWTRQVGRNASTRAQIPSPIRWLYVRHGFVDTSLGLRRTGKAVGPELKAFEEFLPVARLTPTLSNRLKLRSKAEEVPSQQWAALLERVKESTDDDFIGRSYALLLRVADDLLSEEPGVRCRVGSNWEIRTDQEVAVALNRNEFDELVRQQQPVVLVDRKQDEAEAEFMLDVWEMLRYEDVIEKEVRSVLARPAVALGDALPAFKTNPGERAIRAFRLQECEELEEVTRTPSGTTRQPLKSARDGDTVLVHVGLALPEQMAVVDAELGFGLGRHRCEKLLVHYADLVKSQEFRARLAAIRDEESIAGKLALLLSAKQLQAGLPGGLIAREISQSGLNITHARLAELAYNAFDDGVLRQYSADVGAEYQNAPGRFDGGAKALEFVTGLGFPDSFAGARIPSPPQREEARGPVDFPALHEYQDVIARRFVDFLSAPKPQRAMLSLPTGAGKTRVAAEAVIRWIRQFGVPSGPVLWIAQTGELCEQAVQSWRFVWEHVGPGQNLVLDRLWNTNSATPVTGRPHLVVATDAKLASCLGTGEYEWLRRASLVIVDEAHVAISKEYTGILEQLGLTRSKTERNLIGLTATPFRNDENLTQRLAGRFGHQRLDEEILGDNPVARLQELGILSRVQHRELPGAELTLSKSELNDLARMNIDGVLPRSAERRLAADEARNSKLLDEISEMPQDWPVLVFATSVDHAKVLSAGLNDRGIRSFAIDGTTPIADRRRSIDEFRKGTIRVITNFGVLSQGFDAPATRAVVIARPVYSRNMYQQMVGRGLRGAKNGGKEEVLILDVADNVTNFDRKLIFNDFEHLWSSDVS